MRTPSTPAGASSNVDMLRLEAPQTAIKIYHGIRPSLDTVEISQPAAWVRLLVQQQRQAQRDLREHKRACGDKFERTDLKVIEIERNYRVLCEAVQYLYAQQEADTTASHEWIQTELMQAANAAQQFTTDIWRMIVAKTEETTLAGHQQALQLSRLNDALAFLQTANGQRRQEQASFNHNVERWAANQQATTDKLESEHAQMKADLTAIRKRAEQIKGRKPSYLQTARKTPHPPGIPEEPPMAAGGSGGTRPPALPLFPPLPPSEPSEDEDEGNEGDDLYTPGPQTKATKEEKRGDRPPSEDGFTLAELARLIGEGIRAAGGGD